MSQILTFCGLFLLASVLGIFSAAVLIKRVPLGEFHALALVASAAILVYVYSIVFYRIFLLLIPIKEGEIQENSREQFSYNVYLLFYLLLFFPIIRSGFIPVPLMRLFYRTLGARMGKNTYSSGIIFDPPFVDIGDNTLIGQHALLIPHITEGKKLAHHPIRIGNNVTVGAHSVVMSGVTIEDNAIVGVGAVVPKGCRIGRGEIWGGIPARKIKNLDKPEDTLHA